MKILEINNTDLAGKRFNGYDLLDLINNNTNHTAIQCVIDKNSENYNVHEIIENKTTRKIKSLLEQKQSELSLQMLINPFAYKFIKSEDFINADLVHYHLIHNNMFSLTSIKMLFDLKPSILTLHDPWFTTGHCIYPKKCDKSTTGCIKCKFLDRVFKMEVDNAYNMWQLKKRVFENLDVDLIVASKYMEKLVKNNPITKSCKNIHYIPFGIDYNKFCPKESNVREKYNIPKNNIVIFFRAQDTGVKGIEFIREALNLLKTNKKITILTCNDKGLIDCIKDKFQLIDYGWVNDDEEMISLYNACDIFLMPSTAEAFGLMAIEAMSCEKPVIVFENTSLPEITFSPLCGIAVEYENSRKLAEAINYLINNKKERDERGKLGRKLCIEHYDIDRYNDDIINLYESVYQRKINKVKR